MKNTQISVYHLNENAEFLMYSSYEDATKYGTIARNNYMCVCTYLIQEADGVSIEDYLTKLCYRSVMCPELLPEEFAGYRLTESDIFIINKNGTETVYYCDRTGLIKLDAFEEVPHTQMVRGGMYDRIIAARNGVGLDILVSDEKSGVRMEVAKHGRPQDLDVLVKDKKEKVRRAVAKHCRDKDLDVLVKDECYEVRRAVAYCGRPQDLDVLVYDRSASVKAVVAEHRRDCDLDILVNDKRATTRIDVAKQGRDKDLDILVYDEDRNVREAVAKQGRDKDLDILVYDKEKKVREAVARQGRPQDLEILENDEKQSVRKAVKDRLNNVYCWK